MNSFGYPAGKHLKRWLIPCVAVALACSFGKDSLEYPRESLSLSDVQSTRFLAADGELLFERRSEIGGYGTPVSLSDISKHVIDATLSGEDHNFHAHVGIDPLGVARALWLNTRGGKWRYGGSTITQQLAKLIDRQPRNLRGKLYEALDALRLELTLSKSEILTQYLNRAYYGRLAYGIEAAAQRFFGKKANALTLAEASFLAILPRRPSGYNPDKHFEVAKKRHRHVLSLMVERGYITAEQADRASSEPLHFVDPRAALRARHVIDWLLQHYQGTSEAQTHINLPLQVQLQRELIAHLRDIRALGADQGAIVVLDNQTAAVVAMVGSRDYAESDVLGANNGATVQRPAGSTLKPFIYGLALDRGRTANSLILDAPSEWAGYQPRNTTLQHHGLVPFGVSLASSLNLPAVRLANEVGVSRLASTLSQLGFAGVDRTGNAHGLALALGAAPVTLLELTGAFAALANHGEFRPPQLVFNPHSHAIQIFTQRTAQQITNMLSDPHKRQLEFGLETPLDLPFEVAAKTGTSAAFCDNWTVGFTRELTVGVWIGNFNGRPLRGSLAMRGAAPLWQEAMRRTVAQMNNTTGELLRLPVFDSSKGLAQSHLLRIITPAHGSRIRIDPLLPLETQGISLSVAPLQKKEGSRIAWLVDGQPYGERATTTNTSWPLSPGLHQFQAVLHDADGSAIARSPAVSITVEGDNDDT